MPGTCRCGLPRPDPADPARRHACADLVAGWRRPIAAGSTTLHDLSRAIRDAVRYETGATDVDTTAEEALERGLRRLPGPRAYLHRRGAAMLDIPARYVSGYLMMNDRDRAGGDHAWAEAHVEGSAGSASTSPTGSAPIPRYVRVATGRDYREAAPVTGISFGAASEELHVGRGCGTAARQEQ